MRVLHQTVCALLTMATGHRSLYFAVAFSGRSIRHLSKAANGQKWSTGYHKKTQLSSDAGESESRDAVASYKFGEVPATKQKKFSPIPFEYAQEIVIEIEDLTNLGLGIGRYTLEDGRQWVVMVPLVLPGEKVKVRIFRNHSSYSEADLVSVIFSSPDRIKPPCEYFAICGGCQYQHMGIDAQRQWKKSQVESLLLRIGGLQDMEVKDTVGTAELFGYRTKITPHYDTPRSVDNLKIGFQKRGTRIMIDIDKCMIATDKINAQYSLARDKIKKMVSVSPPKKGATLLFRDCEEGVETDHRKIISQKVGEVMFKFKAGEFFQNNAFVLPIMVDHVLSEARATGCTHLIDTYCGSGLFAVSGAQYFSQVMGVEVSDLAVVAARANAELNNVRNAEFICGVSERIFSKVAHFPRDDTVIIIDPPRKGCDDVFLQQLFAFMPKALVYISCDPATQARDAKEIVAAGYRVTNVTPFDLFPQTRHIENVMTFARVL